MAIYELTANDIRRLEPTSFAEAQIRERADLQRLLRDRIGVLCSDDNGDPDLLVIAEEFGDWTESRRRIDLLALDRSANLVVIELKRVEDGGHMELQAIRYAAMVSAMTFEQAVDAHGRFLAAQGRDDSAEANILNFLKWEEANEDEFAQDVRIVLASADFSKELTTAVMWLIERQIDIRCVRLKPYKDNERILLDVQQVIPLPEAEDYIVQVKQKIERERIERLERGGRHSLRRKFWAGLLALAREKTDLFSNVSPSKDSWIAAGAGMRGLLYLFNIRQHAAAASFVLDGEQERNKRHFDILHANREQIEAMFGRELNWQRKDTLKLSRLEYPIAVGGYRDPEERWPEVQAAMIDTMIKLKSAVEPHLAQLRVTDADL